MTFAGARFWVFVGIATLVSGGSPCANAQSRDSGLVGTVMDSSGAVVPDADVTVANVQTGEEKVASTGTRGDYVVLDLLYGEYTVSAKLEGFKTTVVEGVILQMGQRGRVDLTVEVGSVIEVVEVSGALPLLDTERATVSQIIDSKKVLDLPLNGRNWIQLATLAAGVVEPRNLNATGPGFQAGSAVTVNGNGADFNNYTLDGVDNNAPLVNAQSINPTIDSIKEFRIESNNAAAEYGRAAAQITVATRSGTNEVHGSAYEFFRNDALDARNFFDSTGVIPPLRVNTFGGTFGGPIRRDRMFYFLSYDANRNREGRTRRGILPPRSFIDGDFSSLPQQLTDPFGNPLVSNQVRPDQIHPTAKALLDFYPAPNFVDPTFNYITVDSVSSSDDQGIGRVDLSLTDADQLFFRASVRDGDRSAPGLFPIGVGGADQIRGALNFGLSHTHVFSPSTFNVLRVGYNHFNFERLPEGFEKDFSPAVKPPPEADGRFGFIQFGVPGFTGIGFGDRRIKQPEHVYQITDSFSWIIGHHTLKFGLDIRHWQSNLTQTFAYNMAFNGQFTGHSVADMLFGYGSYAFVFDGNFQQHLRRWDQAYYFQDDWRITPTLTLSYGMRWEYLGPLSDQRDNLANFDYDTQQILLVGTSGYPTGRNRTFRDMNNFGPRFGLAWSPKKLPHTVFRAAYGVFYVPAEGQADLVLGPKGGTFYSLFGDVSNPKGLGFDNPAPINTVPGGFPSVSAVDLHIKAPYVQQWNFTIQQEVKGGILLEAGYIGNKGTKLWTIRQSNFMPPGPGPIQSRRLFPQFGGIELNDGSNGSVYHALQTKFEKRYGGGLSLLASYTWSKAIDLNSFLGARLYNPFDLGQDRGMADHDVRHRFITGWVYELPFGRNKRFLKSIGSVANQIVGGWSVGSITTFQSGVPIFIRATGNPANWTQGTRPNVVGEGPLNNPTIRRWFNTDAFEAPAKFTIGNAGRNLLVGPGFQNADIIVLKTIDVAEGHRLQFRGEFFNTFNKPTFNNPGRFLGRGDFAVISTARPGRIIQLGLKYYF